MPDRKITEHEEMLQPDFHDNDVMEIVDVNDSSDAPSGTNKKTKWSTIKNTLKAHFDSFYSTFSGSYNDLADKPTLGSAAAQDSSAFATAAQGAKADTAVQPSDLADVATSGDYSDLDNLPDLTNLPFTGEKQALVGTDGTPSNTNKYVTNSDSRMTNARTPTSHTHAITDVINLQSTLDGKASTDLASGSINGLMSSSNFTKLAGVESNADVTDKDNIKDAIDAVTIKGSIADNDEIVILDSEDSNNIKTTLWSTIKNALGSLFAPKGSVTSSGLTMTTARLLGRYTASTGAIEEITVGSGLSLSGLGVLTATGGGGGGLPTGTVEVNKNGTNQSVTFVPNTPVVVTFSTEVIDDDGRFNSNLLTINSNELWLITGVVSVEATNNGQHHGLLLYKNGALHQPLQQYGSWSLASVCLGFGVLVREPGDYDLRVVLGSGATRIIYGAITDTKLIARRLA